jgi:putative AlgH/UPF0301 family transcriptional regulator
LPFIAARRLVLALLALAAPVTLIAAPSNPAEAPAQPSLKGQLLIATPAMRDPRFDHAVILMVRHDRDGAMGLVINRALGEKPLAELLVAFGAKDTPATGNVRIFLGGPVQLEVGFVVHGTDYRRAETLDVDGRLAATPSREVLRDIAPDEKPHRVRLRRLGARSARRRARPQCLVHGAGRSGPRARRRSRQGVGARHRAADAGFMT